LLTNPARSRVEVHLYAALVFDDVLSADNMILYYITIVCIPEMVVLIGRPQAF